MEEAVCQPIPKPEKLFVSPHQHNPEPEKLFVSPHQHNRLGLTNGKTPPARMSAHLRTARKAVCQPTSAQPARADKRQNSHVPTPTAKPGKHHQFPILQKIPNFQPGS
jgi:hypothetical protein